MYISDTLREALKDMLQESDYYFVLAEIEEAYTDGYVEGYRDACMKEDYECGYHDGWCNCYDNSVV